MKMKSFELKRALEAVLKISTLYQFARRQERYPHLFELTRGVQLFRDYQEDRWHFR